MSSAKPIVKQILGATTEETPYVIENYPYGFTLRTTLRAWIEHKPKFGERAVTQTMNPKNGRWNKPKCGTYNAIEVMGTDEDGHLSFDALHMYRSEEDIKKFVEKYTLNEVQQKTLKLMGVVAAIQKIRAEHTTYTITPGTPVNLSDIGK